MNLYQVFNGYMGNGPVYVIVLAEDEERARVSASEAFKKDAFCPAWNQYRHPESYWTRLEVKFLSDAGVPFVSEVEEG
ncbi:hypothetical protein C171_28592 [Paenibacillus sp. FSL H8-237]|nr:hypothetical protein C171_28592 [Paenibacillus sp. FSL H8-237]